MTARLLSEHSVTSLDVVHHADALAWLRGAPSNWLNCVVTSPPYFQQRDYGVEGQIGLESTPDAYVTRLVTVFRELRRVLRPDGTFWLNISDSYANDDKWGGSTGGKHVSELHGNTGIGRGRIITGLAPKNLIGIPWRLAFALQDDGWYLRSEITWCKTAPMPESVSDRPTSATEKVFMLTKEPRYWYDSEAVRVKSSGVSGGGFSSAYAQNQPAHGAMRLNRPADAGTRNLWNYWLIGPEPSHLGHFAMFPQALIEPMVLAGCPAQVCAVCGAPYERVVEREPMEVRHSGRAAQMGEYGRTCTSGTMIKPPMTHTLGWRATCSCGAATHPGIVYDPFMGSGTTGLVAQRLGRHYIGTDINREYVELARRRVQYRGDDRRMMQEQDAGVEQMALFEHTAA